MNELTFLTRSFGFWCHFYLLNIWSKTIFHWIYTWLLQAKLEHVSTFWLIMFVLPLFHILCCFMFTF